MTLARSAIAAAAVLCLAAACGKSEAPPAVANAERTTCSGDGDCVITTLLGVCDCCPAAPHAIPKTKLEELELKRASSSCLACDPGIECAKHEPESTFVARCQKGTCVSARR